jgi:hypothetical protein
MTAAAGTFTAAAFDGSASCETIDHFCSLNVKGSRLQCAFSLFSWLNGFWGFGGFEAGRHIPTGDLLRKGHWKFVWSCCFASSRDPLAIQVKPLWVMEHRGFVSEGMDKRHP